MAKNNSINNSSGQLTIDPGASGDSFIQFDINTTTEFRIGVDDSDGDAFKISQGTALGTNDTFVMTAAGENTLPLTPAFLGYLGSTDADVTGDGTVFVLGSGTALTEVFDQNGDFTTAGIFTAPVTGRYHFFGLIYSGDLTVSNTIISVSIVTSNRTYELVINPSLIIASGTVSRAITTVADMDASDTAQFQFYVDGATAIVDALGSASGDCSFSGFLAC